MPENSHLDPSLLDNALADFTDRLINGQDINPADVPSADHETVRMLSRTMNAGPPDPAMAARIRMNLAAEWEQTMKPLTQRQAAQPPTREGWWERIQGIFIGPQVHQQGRWRSPKRQQQGFSFALAGLTVIALVFVLVFDIVPLSSLPVEGAVRDNIAAIAIGGVIVGVALGIAAWWTMRRR